MKREGIGLPEGEKAFSRMKRKAVSSTKRESIGPPEGAEAFPRMMHKVVSPMNRKVVPRIKRKDAFYFENVNNILF